MSVTALDIVVKKVEKSRINELDLNNIQFGKQYADHMLVAHYENGEWQQAEIVPFSNLSLSPATTFMHYGQAIFEGVKAYKDQQGNPVIFRPHDNWKRMNRSAERMAMPDVPEELFVGGMRQLVELDKNWIPTADGTSLYIRPFMIATDEFIGVKPAEKFTFLIITSPAGPYYAKPVSIYVQDKYVRAFPGGVGYAKCAGNYGAVMMPTREVQKMGYDQILWLDGIHHKYLQEIGTMNVFAIIDGVIITPSLDQGTILDGVTRDSIIRLAENEGYVVQERDISIDEVITAFHEGKLEDMFGCGTAAVLSHIAQFHYKGENYELPAIEEREISNKLKARLTALKSGKAEDIFQWLHHVPVKVYANI